MANVMPSVFRVARKCRAQIYGVMNFPSLPSSANKLEKMRFDVSYDFWSSVCKRHPSFSRFYVSQLPAWSEGGAATELFSKAVIQKEELLGQQRQACLPETFYKYGIVIVKDFLSVSHKREFDELISHLEQDCEDKSRAGASLGLSSNGIRTEYERKNEQVDQFIHRVKASRFVGEDWNLCRSLAHDFFKADVFPDEFMLIHTKSKGKEPPCESNVIHIDRFLPTIKFFYSPRAITQSQSPFSYVLGSHLIGSDHKEAVWESCRDTALAAKNGKQRPHHLIYHHRNASEVVPVTCPENSLIIAATNGLHGRGGFSTAASAERWLTFIEFYRAFNKLALLRSAV